MRILCVNQALDVRAGSESYLETIIDELLNLGHDVVAWSPRLGMMADRLGDLGCEIQRDLADVGKVDVIHAQQASSTLAARAEHPDVPIVYTCHSWALDVEDPPAAAQPAALVALNDVVADRLAASSLGDVTPIHRLRQPVAMSVQEFGRFPIAARPRLGVAINNGGPDRLDVLDAACGEHGIVLETPTRDGTLTDPSSPMMRADIVFAVGRTALEAMGLARATFVFDQTGSAGFVDAASYATLEASGFTPAPGPPLTHDVLVEELARYEQDLGKLGRELVGRHHAARAHAAQLVEVYRSVLSSPVATEASPDTLSELGRLRRRLFERETESRQAQWERAAAEREWRLVAHELARKDAQLQEAEARADQLEGELERTRRTLSWRITKPLRALRGGRARGA